MRNRYYTQIKIWMTAFLLLWVAACTDEPGVGVKGERDGNKPVMICAATGGLGIATRSGEGQVGDSVAIQNRTMLFTYPSYPDGEMASAKCVFDEAGFGYVYTKVETKEPLMWKDIYVKDKEKNLVEAVYLDNLYNYPVQEEILNPDFDGQKDNRRYLQTDNFRMMYFGKQYPKVADDTLGNEFKRMIAPLGTPAAEEVDIIWGKLENVGFGTTLQFSLQHKMAAVGFRFHSEVGELQQALNGDKIRVWVDYLRIWLETPGFEGKESTEGSQAFSRLKGEIYQDGQPGARYSQKNVFWVKDSLLQSDETNMVFSTPIWVLPPDRSQFRVFGHRPELFIDLGEDKVFHGLFPETMDWWRYDNNKREWVEYKNVPLKLWPGYQFTFNVKLLDKVEGREIEFVNVEVTGWSTKLIERPVLGESGITNWDDLMALAKAYNKNPSKTNYRLMRFGMWSEGEGKWVFNLLRNIEVPVGTALPEFNGDNFKIDFRGFHINVGGTDITEEQLSTK